MADHGRALNFDLNGRRLNVALASCPRFPRERLLGLLHPYPAIVERINHRHFTRMIFWFGLIAALEICFVGWILFVREDERDTELMRNRAHRRARRSAIVAGLLIVLGSGLAIGGILGAFVGGSLWVSVSAFGGLIVTVVEGVRHRSKRLNASSRSIDSDPSRASFAQRFPRNVRRVLLELPDYWP